MSEQQVETTTNTTFEDTFSQIMESFTEELISNLGETWNGDINYSSIGKDYVSRLLEHSQKMMRNTSMNSYKKQSYKDRAYDKHRKAQKSYETSLDFFDEYMLPDFTNVFELIESATDENKALYLSLYCMMIMYTRGIRSHSGKGERGFSYHMFGELYNKFPETALNLLSLYPQFGYFKDLDNIATIFKDNNRVINRCIDIYINAFDSDMRQLFGFGIIADNGPVFKSHQFKCRVFQLVEELQRISPADLKTKYGHLKLTMSGKWAVRDGKKMSFVRNYMLARFYGYTLDNYLELSDKTKNFNDMLYRKFLSCLNKLLNTVEVNMAGNDWHYIDPSKVPSMAMMKYRKAFLNTDYEGGERTTMESRQELAKRTIQASADGLLNSVGLDGIKFATLLKQNINKQLSSAERLVIHSQFMSIVDNLKTTLAEHKTEDYNPFNVIATIDVSGSMSVAGVMESAIVLGIMTTMISDLGNSFLTFSDNPQVRTLDLTGDIFDWYKYVLDSEWGGSTDIDKANMKLIEIMKVVREKSPEFNGRIRHIIFTDGQFDPYFCKFGEQDWNTFADRMMKRFTSDNFSVPETVFWNMNSHSSGFPASGDMKGMTLASGNSFTVFNNILTNNVEYITDEKGNDVANTDPNTTFLRALCHEDYHPVVDMVFYSNEGAFINEKNQDYVQQFMSNYM